MKILKSIIIGLACFLVLASLALAAVYLWVTTVTVTVTEGEYNAVVYLDSDCTIPWNSEDLHLEQNQAFVKTVYVKNVGTNEINIALDAQGQTGFGMVMFSPESFVLPSGEIQSVEVTIYALPDASIGEYNFSIIAYSP